MTSDPGRYGYVDQALRPRLQLPNNARLALWVVVNHELYEFSPLVRGDRHPWPRVNPDILGFSRFDYGNRAGAWRLLGALDRIGIPVSLNVNAGLLHHFPDFTGEAVARDWEVLSHGLYNTRYASTLTETQERIEIETCIEVIESHTGKRPLGWMGPLATLTEHTFDLLAEYGFTYTVDLFHEDEPFPVRVKRGRLISVPYSQETNDWAAFDIHHTSPAGFARIVQDQFDCLYREGGASARVMCIGLHPYLIGHPHRLGHFERVLHDIVSRDGVWITTGAEIADWYYGSYYEVVRDAIDGAEQMPDIS